MSDKFLCVLAGYDAITENELNKIKNILDQNGFIGNQTKGLPNHITLGYFSVDREKELIDKLQAISSELNVVNISFNHIGIFGGSKVIFISPDTNSDLINLKEKFEENINWTPHSTLLIDEPEIIQKVIPLIMDNFKPMQGTIESLHLYEFMPARHILSVSLQNNR